MIPLWSFCQSKAGKRELRSRLQSRNWYEYVTANVSSSVSSSIAKKYSRASISKAGCIANGIRAALCRSSSFSFVLSIGQQRQQSQNDALFWDIYTITRR